MQEIWKDVVGYEGLYLVSNLGRIKTVQRFVKRGKAKDETHPVKEKIRKQAYDKKGYRRIGLTKDGTLYTEKVHRLVAKAFIPNPDSREFVNHKNGIKHDNRVENLEWSTPKENLNHAVENNLIAYNSAEEHHNSKLSNEDVKNIRGIGLYRGIYKDLSDKYNVSAKTIKNVIDNKTYKNII